MSSKNITSKSFTVQAEVNDDLSGLGKIDWYMKKQDEEYNMTTEEYTPIGGNQAGDLITNKEINYKDLTSGTYYIYAKITDVAGNVTTTDEITVTLLTITNGADGIEITSSNENWTNEDVKITATSKDARYTILTSKDSTNWSGSGTVNFEQNGTFYTRLTDGINVGEITSRRVENIDKTKAEVQFENINITSRSFTTKVEIQDNLSGLGKIDIYYKKLADENYRVQHHEYKPIKGNVAGSTDISKALLVDGLTSGTYQVYVVVTDVAGNETTTEQIETTLTTITPADTGLTITQNNTNPSSL